MSHLPQLILPRLLKSLSNLGSFCQLPTPRISWRNSTTDRTIRVTLAVRFFSRGKPFFWCRFRNRTPRPNGLLTKALRIEVEHDGRETGI
jgi:hypothetical protein